MLFMTELCSCRSTRTLAHASHDTIQSVSMTIDSVIIRDSVVIRYEERNDTVLITKQEFHDTRKVCAINNSDKQCSTDTLKTVEDKPEPKARSTLRQERTDFSFNSILKDIKGFLIIAGIASILFLLLRIKRF
jgi:hypothetical protein